MLCSACQRFHPASCTYYGKEQTQTGTFLWLYVYVYVIFMYLICFQPNLSWLHRHIPNSVMSIDLSHHIDNADDDNAAAQWVPLMSFLPFNLLSRQKFSSVQIQFDLVPLQVKMFPS